MDPACSCAVVLVAMPSCAKLLSISTVMTNYELQVTGASLHQAVTPLHMLSVFACGHEESMAALPLSHHDEPDVYKRVHTWLEVM
jgi:hypothetical protein